MRPLWTAQLLKPGGLHDARASNRTWVRLWPSRRLSTRSKVSATPRYVVPLRLPSSDMRRAASMFSGSWTNTMRITNARLALNEKPEDVTLNRELFAVLLDDKTRSSTTVDEVIQTYETKSGLFSDQPTATNAFLSDQTMYDLYLRALASTEGGGDKVLSASQRRASILYPASSVPDASLSSTGVGAPGEAAQHGLSNEQLTAAIMSAEHGDKAKTLSSDTPKVTRAPTATYSGAAGASSNASGASSNASGGTKSDPIRVVVSHEKESMFWRLLKPLLSAVLWTLVILTVISFLAEQGPGSIMRAAAGNGPSEFKPSPGSQPATFADVHGCEEAKAELQEVVEFLKDPAKFSKLGGKLTRGILLTGPPGTGKTLLARAVAGEAGVSFYIASGADFDEIFVGVGAKRIRELFAAARKGAPAIIFIDELDAVGGKRSPRDITAIKQTLNSLLVEMDGFKQDSGIIVIGATNLPDTLDKALIRPGRFDRHIAVPLPDVRGRLAILRHYAQKNKVPYDEKLVAMSEVARGTPGFSGAELEALVNQAAVRASLDNSDVVLPKHFEWAKDRIMLGSERKSAVVSPKARNLTAWHEAGHAMMAIFTSGAAPLHKITVIPRGNAGGITFQLPEMDQENHSLAELRAMIDVCMGGRAAEEMIFGHDNVTNGAASDIEKATQIAKMMVRRFGFSEAVGPVSMPEEESERQSTETRALIEKEVRSLIEAAQARALALLTAKKLEFERLANALLTHETLSGSEAKRVINGETLDRPPL